MLTLGRSPGAQTSGLLLLLPSCPSAACSELPPLGSLLTRDSEPAPRETASKVGFQ